MNTIKITKFQIGHNYHSKTSKLLYRLKERNDKELVFRVIHSSGPYTSAIGTLHYEATKNGAQETVRVGGIDGFTDLYATIGL